MTETLLWYDYETSGTDAGFDRVLQFAGIRTNLELEMVEEPINLFCYPGEDVIPDPVAMQVTGLKMSEIQTQGLSEAEFARSIQAEFSKPNTCVVGYNSIRFDDEFTRYLLYRNFFDPYAREWQGGNSRWDVIDLFRMAAALRPEGFSWPTRDDGHLSFKLELLSAANGVGHEQAHDAVSDVKATIDVVKKLKEAQPKLYDYSFRMRRKKAVLDQLYPLGKQPIVHVSSMYPAERFCTAVVLPLTVHPTNSNGVICVDLTEDPSELLALNPTELHQRMFTRQPGSNLPRIPLKTIHVNRCPAVAPLSTLGDRKSLLGVDLDRCREHQTRLQQTAGLVEKIAEVFTATEFEKTNDPDLMLYQGEFFGAEDRQIMAAVHDSEPMSLGAFQGQFRDARLPEMLLRFRARNFPDTLREDEAGHWREYLESRRASEMATDRTSRLESMLADDPQDEILQDLNAFFS